MFNEWSEVSDDMASTAKIGRTKKTGAIRAVLLMSLLLMALAPGGVANADQPSLAPELAEQGHINAAEVEWVARAQGEDNPDHNGAILDGAKLAAAPDASKVFVAGTVWAGPFEDLGDEVPNDALVLAYDPSTGEELWRQQYDRANRSDISRGVAVSPDSSRVFVTMNTQDTEPPGPIFDGRVVAYDADNGTEVWSVLFDWGPGGDGATPIAVSHDGSKVFVGGATTTFAEHFNAQHMTALNADTGEMLWRTTYDGINYEDCANRRDRTGGIPPTLDGTWHVGVSPDDSIMFATGVICAINNPQADSRTVTHALDTATGEFIWTNVYDNPDIAWPSHEFTQPGGLATSPNGDAVFVTTTAYTTSIRTFAYDAATGEQLWTAAFQRSIGAYVPAGLVVSPDSSRVFVAGKYEECNTGCDQDYATISYDAATGEEVWVANYDGGSETDKRDRAFAIAISPDGSQVFTTGGSGLNENSDYATVAYAADTGDELWVERYDGPTGFGDSATAIGRSPDGSRLFVSGISRGDASGGFDNSIATVAYDVTDEPPPPSGASEDVVATVPEQPGQGSLVISVNPTDRVVTLPPVALAPSGDRMATSGGLRPVTVTDTRTESNPGWDASAQVSEFDAGSSSFGGGFLGWSPLVLLKSEGQEVAAGGPVAPGFPSGDGLSVPQTLAIGAPGAGSGTAVLSAGLRLEIPTTTAPGRYTALLTLTAI